MSLGRLLSSLGSNFSRQGNVTAFREYDSFESALRASDSYEDPRLIEVVFEKTKIYREHLSRGGPKIIKNRQTVQNMFVISYIQCSRPISVMEIGGACGAGYFEMRQLLPGRIEQWATAETPPMAAAGRKLINDQSLSFHADCGSAARSLKTRDLVIAQGVLQYACDPFQVLTELFDLNFDYVYVSRTVVLLDDSPIRIFTQQTTQLSAHGPGTLPRDMSDGTSTQPMVLVDRNSLLAAIPSSYRLLFVFEESEERDVLISGQTRRLTDLGFLAQRSE